MSENNGRFVWHELHTGNRAAAQKFFTQLLGWHVNEVPMGPGDVYGMCTVGGVEVAGITKSMAPAGVPPHWLTYIAVDDVDAFTKKAQGLGAKAMVPPTDIPNVGRFSILGDPQGAAIGLYKASRAYSPEPERPALGTFCWEELLSSDPEASAKFYSSLFGYSLESHDMGPMGTYRILKRGTRQAAGIMKLPPNVPVSSWLPYLHAKDVDASTRNAREIGAKVMMEPMDIPNIGRFSVIADPTDAVVALFTGKM